MQTSQLRSRRSHLTLLRAFCCHDGANLHVGVKFLLNVISLLYRFGKFGESIFVGRSELFLAVDTGCIFIVERCR